MKTFKKFIIINLLFIIPLVTFSQGVTTSSIKGKVTDSNGTALFAANVVAIHTPTGTQYGTITIEDGRFIIPNMKIGGPYTITITFIGYQEVKREGVYLQLNKTADL
ncbi:MAG: carboxypeptidase regulatory-like domain-containing protein, partial [Bacteroidales bacterium]|nr:carboxypeptidase regulatory-like domain-containing protein [Bacteroidales bacterium]